MAISIESGPARVLASGAATCFMGHGLVIQVTEPVALSVEIAFEDRPELPDVAVEVDTAPERVRFRCANFDQADGRGTAAPALLGEAGDLLLFLHFRVFKHGRTADRTVHYTLFVVDKDRVGWTPTPA